MRKHLTKGRVIIYLFCLTLACTLVFGVTYARFHSKITGMAAAQTAAVALGTTLDLSSRLQGLQPGDETEISFNISNFSKESGKQISEVGQEYTITIATTGNLPLEYAITQKTAVTTSQSAEEAADTGSYVTPAPEKANVWTGGLLPSGTETTHQYTLTVRWPQEQNNYRYSEEIDLVTLTVDAVQTLPQVSSTVS